MATIKKTEIIENDEVQPKPVRKKRKKKVNYQNQGEHKLINGVDHMYCTGSFGYWPATEFNNSSAYCDAFLVSKKVI